MWRISLHIIFGYFRFLFFIFCFVVLNDSELAGFALSLLQKQEMDWRCGYSERVRCGSGWNWRGLTTEAGLSLFSNEGGAKGVGF